MWSSSAALREHSQLDICLLRPFYPTMPYVQPLIVMLECGPTLHVTIPLLQNNRSKGWKVKDIVRGAFSSSKHLIQQLNVVLLSAVMTYPAESVQIGYQNHVEDIRSFLDSRHADHYTVFNLSQRNYRGAKFSNRVSVMLRMKPGLLLCTELFMVAAPFSFPELHQY